MSQQRQAPAALCKAELLMHLRTCGRKCAVSCDGGFEHETITRRDAFSTWQ